MPKIAGIESSANSRSVVPSAMITISIGETTRAPFARYQSLRPRYSSPTLRWVCANLTTRLSSGCSSSWLR